MVVEREKYMDMKEVKTLRTVTKALAIVDSRPFRVQGAIA